MQYGGVNDLGLIEEVKTFENLTSAELAAEIALSTALRPGDTAYLRIATTSLPGRWSGKTIAGQLTAPDDANCLAYADGYRGRDRLTARGLLMAVMDLSGYPQAWERPTNRQAQPMGSVGKVWPSLNCECAPTGEPNTFSIR